MDVWVDQAEIISELSDLGIDTTPWSTNSYEKLNKEILKAQREFERLTRRKFQKDTLVEKIDGMGTAWIILRYFPVIGNVVVTITDIPQYQQTLQLAEYRLERETGRLTLVSTRPFLIATFPRGNLNIEATYEYGYEVVDIPEDIKDTISDITMMSVIFRTPADWEKSGLKSIRIAQYAESYNTPGSGKASGGIYAAQKTNWVNLINETISRYKRIPIV